jgi:hypothetical protein
MPSLEVTMNGWEGFHDAKCSHPAYRDPKTTETYYDQTADA